VNQCSCLLLDSDFNVPLLEFDRAEGTVGTKMNITISGGRGNDPEEISANQRAERHLWIAVLAKAVEDWTSRGERLREAAQKFLFNNDKDSEAVCSRARLSLTYLRERLRRARPPVLMTPLRGYLQKALHRSA
jgi:hypothetical protein